MNARRLIETVSLEGKYLRFVPTEGAAKTSRWHVIAKEGGLMLGVVKWYGPWRCYSFFPAPVPLVFEKKCLRDLADFCEAQTQEHRARPK